MLKHPETDHGTPLTTFDQVCVHNPKYGVVVDMSGNVTSSLIISTPN